MIKERAKRGRPAPPTANADGRKPRLTIREIAREAGVSTATVSRALNTPEKVAATTRRAVQAVVERHHYISHGMAMSLASDRSNTLGLIIPTITNSIYASSTQAIQQAARRAGFTLLLGVSDFSADLEVQLLRRLLERRVDGLILTGGERAADLYETIRANAVPYVVTWKLTGGQDHPCVSFDNYAAGRLAMQHLLDLGHRRIALICGRSAVNDRARERRRAYEDCLAEQGLPVQARFVFERDFEFSEGCAAMQRILEGNRSDRPSAVFCANDIQAIGALTACQDAGLNVPKDMSVIGFDDLPVASYTIPQLTTVRVPANRMGSLAALKVIEWVATGRRPASEALPVELVVRRSTARPPGSMRG